MHQRTHSGTNPHHCETCNAFFSRASKLADHFRTNIHKRKVIEKGIPGTLNCSRCSVMFETEEEMYEHMKEEHDLEPDVKKLKTSDETFSSDGEGSDAVGEESNDVGENDGESNPIFNCDSCNLQFTT